MCDERQTWSYKEPAVSLDLADGPSLFINFNELSENELESNFGLRSGASLNPYMTKIDICESEPSDFLSFGASNFILRRRAFRLNNYDPSDSLQLKLDFDEDLESFLNIGIIKKGFQIDVYLLFLRNTNDVIGSIGNPLKEDNYVGIYFNFTAWQEYIGGVPKKSNGELRFPNPLNTLKLGLGRRSQSGEISTGTHLIVIPEIECGVVTGQSDASILIVYRQFLLQVETGLLVDQSIEDKIKNLISQSGFSN